MQDDPQSDAAPAAAGAGAGSAPALRPQPPAPEPVAPEAITPAATAAPPGEVPAPRGVLRTLAAAAVVFVSALLLYSGTLMPSVGSGPAARIQAAAHNFDLGGEARDHPLTVALGHLFTGIPVPPTLSPPAIIAWLPLRDIACRVNLAGATAAALTVLVVFLAALARLDASGIATPRSRLLFAAAGAASLAVAHAFWARAVVADQTPVVVLLLALATALFLWHLRGRGAWTILLGTFLVGLAVADQRAVGLIAPFYLVVGVVMLARARPAARSSWLVVIAFAAGLLPLVYLAALELIPTPAATATIGEILQRVIGGPRSLRAPLDAATIAGTRFLASFLIAGVFAVIGLAVLIGRRGGRREGLFLLGLIATAAAAALVTPSAAVAAWVPVAISVAVGCAALFRRGRPRVVVVLGLLLVAVPLATYALLPRLAANRNLAPWVGTAVVLPAPSPEPVLHPWRGGDRASRSEALAVLAATGDGAILVTDPNRAETFRYLLDVEERRSGLTVLTPRSPGLTALLAAEIGKRPIAVAGLSWPDIAVVQREAELIQRGPIARARPRPPSLVLADRLFAEHKFWEAAFNYSEALMLRPEMPAGGDGSVVDDAEALARWTVALTHANLPDLAAKIAPRYLAAVGDPAEASVRLGELFADTAAPTWAEHHFAEALAVSPPPALAAYIDGRIAELRGEHESARQFYRRALRLNPDMDTARARLMAGVEPTDEPLR